MAVTDDAGVDGGPVAGAPDASVYVAAVDVRVVNGCSAAIDLFRSNDATAPIVTNVQAGQVTGYLPLTLDSAHDALAIRQTGQSPVLSTAESLDARTGDRFTVVLRGAKCSAMALKEQFGATPPGMLRLRFVDTLAKDTPTRLFLERRDGVFVQLAAVDPLGDSGPDGVLVAVPGDRPSVRVEVGAELSSGTGTPGYQIPSAVLKEGATLFVLNRLLALWLIDKDGPVAVTVAAGDPPGTIRVNPSVAVLNAVPDLCATGASRFSFSDASNRPIAALDVRFGSESRLVLPPTETGHTLQLIAGASCPNPGSSAQLSSGPLSAGARTLLIVFGSAATGQLQRIAIDDRAPAMPSVTFLSAALGAPPLDIQEQTATGPPMTVFATVPFGVLAPSISAPTQDYNLLIAQQPAVKGAYTASLSWLSVAIGDWNAQTTVPLRLVPHRLQ
jgi:hypothetical protein